MFPQENMTMIPLNWKLKLPLDHFGLLMSLKTWAKKGVTVLPVVIDPNYQGQIGLTTTTLQQRTES